MIKVDYPDLLGPISYYNVPQRNETAAFLMWYLEKYYKLEPTEAIDSVCDQRGDKGIDGIYLNEGEGTIDVFQAKISQDSQSKIGDKGLREFYGTLSQFDSRKAIENLINTAGNAQVAGLIKRLDLLSKIDAYTIRGVFLSNTDLDNNGEAYLNTLSNIEFIGKTKLENAYISDSRKVLSGKKANFDISGFKISEYFVDSDTLAIIAPIKANELVALEGISDQSIFAFNVRGPLGRTKVNRDIVRSIKEQALHKQFPLFHNGINIICEKLDNTKEKIKIETYFVVNGCQSLTALYDNKKSLTDNLRILTKFIKVSFSSPLSEIITQFSNNQNGIKSRDFKSNNLIQIRLQNEVSRDYGSEYHYEIKRGESSNGKEVISNEISGIYLWSFDLKEPWNTHRKYQVFDDKYADLFGRPEVNADRIIMLYLIDKIIQEFIPKINNQLFGKYALTRYAILYILRQIFENDDVGGELLRNPREFIRNVSERKHFKNCLKNLIHDILIDLNAEIKDLGEDFDYKSKLRDDNWVKDLSKNIVTSYLKLVHRGRIDSFGKDWQDRQKILSNQLSE